MTGCRGMRPSSTPDVADPRCGFGIDTRSAKAMFAGARRLADPGEIAAMRPDLPIYIAAGENDPVNGQLTLLTPLADRYRAAGLADVTVRTYPQARHEILNEINNAEVIAAISSWVDRVLSSAGLPARLAAGPGGTGQLRYWSGAVPVRGAGGSARTRAAAWP